MSVKYRAVHTEKPWRKVSHHKTIESAVNGKDGAIALLLKQGRIAGMWDTHGDPICVFVWEDGATMGSAYRLHPTKLSEVQSVEVDVATLEEFESQGGCDDDRIDELFPLNDRVDPGHLFPDELTPTESYVEGATTQIQVNSYERDPKARDACIAHYGCYCQACGFDFGKVYCERGAGFIHVHHIIQLSDICKAYRVNPSSDLVPVCPNCHAMLHKRKPPFNVAELKGFIANGKASQVIATFIISTQLQLIIDATYILLRLNNFVQKLNS